MFEDWIGKKQRQIKTIVMLQIGVIQIKSNIRLLCRGEKRQSWLWEKRQLFYRTHHSWHRRKCDLQRGSPL